MITVTSIAKLNIQENLLRPRARQPANHVRQYADAHTTLGTFHHRVDQSVAEHVAVENEATQVNASPCLLKQRQYRVL
ncbi:hypothetical protein [Noviherbaspirillum galbum]|uniref:Uncharacterized protein n=1 Tax=Noviherbaspirillum galbum TaxID=2709383 RepID=A0A6B3SNE3_9BURK|nr:hypothetical protein [Noviherbaspirillum galbum]NEX59942.1 hypothetical protein [Noviherbaspirillum galbum]